MTALPAKDQQRPAVFLDRDGTINIELGYLRHPEQFRLLPGVAEAIGALNRAGWAVVVVSNQSALGRGFSDEALLEEILKGMKVALAEGGAHLDGVFICPHAPWEVCSCRKPSPELVFQAAQELTIDLSRSWFVGDKTSDVETGRRAGCRTALVLTGYGHQERDSASADLVARDLAGAVAAILNSEVG